MTATIGGPDLRTNGSVMQNSLIAFDGGTAAVVRFPVGTFAFGQEAVPTTVRWGAALPDPGMVGPPSSTGHLYAMKMPFTAPSVPLEELPPPRWFAYVRRRLTSMAERSTCAESEYPMRPTIERAWRFALRELPSAAPAPSVVPSGDSGVSFVWHKQGWDIEISVGEADIDVWARDRNTKGRISWAGSWHEYREHVASLLTSLGGDRPG